jgi:methionine synthase II (cobalamin-independent)
MQRSETAIRTTHAGRLPPVGAADTVTGQVAEVIRKQMQLGLSCVGDGEFWNGRNFQYYAQQFEGITTRPLRPGERGSGREATRERDTFPKLYADMDRVGTMFCVPGEEPRYSPPTKMIVTGPIKGRATSNPPRDRCLQDGARGRRRRRGGFHLRVRAGLARSSHFRRALR